MTYAIVALMGILVAMTLVVQFLNKKIDKLEQQKMELQTALLDLEKSYQTKEALHEAEKEVNHAKDEQKTRILVADDPVDESFSVLSDLRTRNRRSRENDPPTTD